jgi:site-specific recombinase XerC
MTYAHLQLVTPTTAKRTVTPRRLPNHELRPREHLTEREVARLIEAAKKNRNGQRDAAIILICFRHGLRASELCELQWSDVEFETAAMHLPGEEWRDRDTPTVGRRIAGVTCAETRGQVAVYLRQRARSAVHRIGPAKARRSRRYLRQDSV